MKSQLYFKLNNEDIPIIIKRSRRQSLTLSLNAAGDITIKAPLYILKRDIQFFIKKQSEWLTKRLIISRGNIREFSFTPGSKVPYMGDDFLLQEGSHKRGIITDKNLLVLPKNYKNPEVELIKWYRDTTRKKLTEMVNYYTDIMGIKYNRIFIKAQKSRWGSCSGKGNLNFNWKIILTPEELIKYLVIHEVCHLIEMNHSINFWNLVEKYDPSYRKNRKSLQKYGYYLLSFLE